MISVYIGGLDVRRWRYPEKRICSKNFFQKTKILHLQTCVLGELSNERFENQIENQIRYGSR